MYIVAIECASGLRAVPCKDMWSKIAGRSESEAAIYIPSSSKRKWDIRRESNYLQNNLNQFPRPAPNSGNHAPRASRTNANRRYGDRRRIYSVGTKPKEAAERGKEGQTDHMFAEDWFPIQVKLMDKVDRPDIDQFEAVMERENCQRGFFVSFAYSRNAEQECAAFHKRTNRIIKLLTVQEILDEEHVQKM